MCENGPQLPVKFLKLAGTELFRPMVKTGVARARASMDVDTRAFADAIAGYFLELDE